MATLGTRLKENRRNGLIGSGTACFLGLVFLMSPLGNGLSNLSFDFLYLLQTTPASTLEEREARVILFDDESLSGNRYEDMLERFAITNAVERSPKDGGKWHRSLHARLIDELRRQQAKAIVFDVWFDSQTKDKNQGTTDSSLTNAIDLDLAQAIRSHGNVILGAGLKIIRGEGQVVGTSLDLPIPQLAQVAHWGHVHLPRNNRTYASDPKDQAKTNRFPLAWKAAELIKALPDKPPVRCWLQYYGPPGTIPSQPYYEVLDPDKKGTADYKDKVVFIGAGTITSTTGKTSDVHDSSYSTWGYPMMPGIEIHATAFLNLIHQEFLFRIPEWIEFLLHLLTAALFGFGFVILRPGAAALGAVAAVALITGSALWMVSATGYWFSWLILVLVQIPVTMVWAVIGTNLKLNREKAVLEKTLATALSGGATPQAPAGGSPLAAAEAAEAATVQQTLRPGDIVAPPIPDHTMLQCVGKGAYGEVWLAKDIIGSYHAVKVVYQRNFASDSPYLREFRAIKKFTPVSRSHPGLVNILHVGRNEEGGYFYCIMEAGDDEHSGATINPNHYHPRNLARDLHRRGNLSVRDCLDLGIPLADALQFLHGKGLIHRDIKPSNIIFVNGQPKFADIGLVTDIANTNKDVSFLGTEGFIAPEGPGTPAADVYSLGKLLYETSMGRDRNKFPELPTNLDERPDEGALLQLNQIILKACENDPTDRYQTAKELLEDLTRLKGVSQ